ncbi:MAG: dTDP-4-dehydrorhamnose reductase [Ruminococcus sp.]|nr:dTDP-4-dehydrorhamnose reductase [Ruminococcus sp.]
MKVLVTGASGQLGQDVILQLREDGHTAIGTDINDEFLPMDITDIDKVHNTLHSINPDAVIHCAAWTAVDSAEDLENQKKVFDINHKGTENIATVCKELDIKLLYTSTDYVFNGEGTTPWDADCDNYAPVNIYGKSKLHGELAVSSTLTKFFIVRIQWVYGAGGKNFIKTMLNVGKRYECVKVVNDQIGSPTYTKDLARLFSEMIVTDKYGYYHARNEGNFVSWYDLTCKLYKLLDYSTKIVPVTTEEYGLSNARRPKNSRLDTSKLAQYGFTPLPDWEDAVERYIKELENRNLL